MHSLSSVELAAGEFVLSDFGCGWVGVGADFGAVGSVGVPVAGGVAPGSKAGLLFPSVVAGTGGSVVVRAGCTVAGGPGLGVVGLAAPGALVASGPQAPSITQHHRITRTTSEQS